MYTELYFRRRCLLLVIFLLFPFLNAEALQIARAAQARRDPSSPQAGEAPKPQLLNADSNATLRYPVAVWESSTSYGWLDVTRSGLTYTVVNSRRLGKTFGGRKFAQGEGQHLVTPASDAGNEGFEVSSSEIRANGLKGGALIIAFSNRYPQIIYLPPDQWGTVDKPRQFQEAGVMNLAGTMAIQRSLQNFDAILATVQPPAPASVDVSLHADPPSVEKGRPVALVWNSSNATSLDLEPGVGHVAAAGGVSLLPQDSTNYTLTASGPAGTKAASVYVTVTAPAPVVLPTIVLTDPPAAGEGQTVEVTSSPLVIRGVVMDTSGIPVVTINGKSVTMRSTSAQAAQFRSDPIALQVGENRFEVSAINGARGEAKVAFVAHLSTSTPKEQPAAPINSKGLGKAEILGLLQGDVPSARVAELVKERGLKFVPTQDDLKEIRAAGGADDLIDAINQSPAPARN
jgi:hypothetical protein